LYEHAQKLNRKQIEKHGGYYYEQLNEWKHTCKRRDETSAVQQTGTGQKREGRICATQSKHTRSLDGKYRCDSRNLMNKYLAQIDGEWL
jgi:hypothetical protein